MTHDSDPSPRRREERDALMRALPPHLRAVAEHLGALVYEPETFTVSAHDIAKFAAAIGANDPIYSDERAAIASGLRGIVAPRGFHISLGTMRGRLLPRSEYATDGMPAEERLEEARLVVGGSTTEFIDEIYAGDTITVEQQVGPIQPRMGRSGPMVFVELERRYRRGDGSLVMIDRITRILR
jgi:acyl dehydratase